MKAQIIIIPLIFILVISCLDNNKPTANFSNKSSNDIVIGKRVINQGDGGIGETVYFLVRNQDTSNLRYDFSQNALHELEITIHDYKFSNHPNLSYREEIDELKQIFGEAAKDFELRFLKKIWAISLLSTGDLAIAITKQLPPEYPGKPIDNLYVARFLLTSKLTDDLNELLKPYGKKIKKYVVEKAGFLESSVILKFNKIESPKSEIPSKVLDAQIWPVIENNGD